MGVLTGHEPAKALEFFEKICSIPHGSGNIKGISDFLADFAKERNLRYRQDEKGNVVIWKDGSKGYENAEPLIMQGHIDMVAVKEPDCAKDMEKDGLDLMLEGDMISAKGTSLGGDDGIAVAYTLAVLDDDTLSHPPIEALFTADEEVGLLGADFLDVSDLKGKLFLNIDSEDEGVFTISCAGGLTATCLLPCERETRDDVSLLHISLENFLGGHSGVEIDKGRPNANVVMGRMLWAAGKAGDISLVSVNGGEKDNAIADSCQAALAVKHGQEAAAEKAIRDEFETVKDEYKAADPNMCIAVTLENVQSADTLTGESTRRIVNALMNLPNGIQRMNPEIEGLVQTSLNLGILRTKEDQAAFSYAVRSAARSERDYLADRLQSFAEACGGTVELSGAYPGWDYRADSRLRDTLVEAYKAQYGKEPVIEGIHAGLECGIFAEKIKDLDAVSIGPQMWNVHTVNERLSLSSAERTWKLIVKTLELLR